MSGVLSKSSFELNDTTLDVIVIRHDDGSENETYFFASEVAKMLGYKNVWQAIRRRCPKRIKFEDMKRTRYSVAGCEDNTFVETQGCYSVAGCEDNTFVEKYNDLHPHTTMIPESDVYRLVMGSKIPTATVFQDFVCDVVLPSIRRHGQYPPPNHQQQRQVPSIGYNIGDHKDRMKHFESLDDDERKEMRKETLTETNSLKDERQVERGSRGGNTRVFNERRRNKDHEELKKEYGILKEIHYDLNVEHEDLKHDYEVFEDHMEDLKKEHEELEYYFENITEYYHEENERLKNRVHELEMRLAKVVC